MTNKFKNYLINKIIHLYILIYLFILICIYSLIYISELYNFNLNHEILLLQKYSILKNNKKMYFILLYFILN